MFKHNTDQGSALGCFTEAVRSLINEKRFEDKEEGGQKKETKPTQTVTRWEETTWDKSQKEETAKGIRTSRHKHDQKLHESKKTKRSKTSQGELIRNETTQKSYLRTNRASKTPVNPYQQTMSCHPNRCWCDNRIIRLLWSSHLIENLHFLFSRAQFNSSELPLFPGLTSAPQLWSYLHSSAAETREITQSQLPVVIHWLRTSREGDGCEETSRRIWTVVNAQRRSKQRVRIYLLPII